MNYSNCRIVVVQRKESGELIYLKDETGYKARDVYLELGSIDEGEYLIFISIDWRTETPEADKFFNVTSYGAGETQFEYHNQNADSSI